MVLVKNISVIIPAHNERENLIVLIPRLITISKGFNVEIIIALSAESHDIDSKDFRSKQVSLITCANKGRAVQMNQAAKTALGDILVFLHADVLPPISFFKNIQETISSGMDAGFFSYKFNTDNFWLKINAHFTKTDGIFTGGGDQCLFIKKCVFETLGAFDEDQVLMEDFEFFKRMKKAKMPYTIVNNDLIVSARKYHNNSYVKVNFCNLLMVVLFKCGYKPEKLKTLYDRLLKTA
ncbi:glycosyltransferase [Bizionia algoritergicola]|uniref:Glycosyltransferase n=1 Tax=Bizionia algoritergicola TaxID=291187 RepID=A0A5D0R281_9FLAO|nr:glycosyltransferase [Bizionia sp. APA-3]OBX23896.1 glycosyl transferase [Bizionia sp. APA-3]TYB75587.1 glycosyltransferase [Bizionia algoritergicola]